MINVVDNQEELFKFAYQLRKIDPIVRNKLTTILLKDILEGNG